jgi:amidase
MPITSVPSDWCIYAFSEAMEPVVHVACGETLILETQDALGGQVRSEADILTELDFSRINPATGPVHVDGAEPGDTLVVRVLSIKTADWGAIVTGPDLGVLGGETEAHATRILAVEDGHVVFGDLRLVARPMIGVLGVAPREGRHPTGTAHRHGGNMDTKEIVAGCTVYLPVAQFGALLALGDVHAVQGDGEVCVSACEVWARVTVEVDLIKGRCPEWPIVALDRSIYILVSLPTIGEALEEATRQAVQALQASRGLSHAEAVMLASLAVDIGVSQLVDPNKTAKARIPMDVLGANGFPFDAGAGGANGVDLKNAKGVESE